MRAVNTKWSFVYAVAILGLAAPVLCAEVITQAGLITFDNIAPTANSVLANPTRTNRTGALTQLQIITAGVTVTIERENGARFDLVNNFLSTQTGKPDEWGTDEDNDGDVQAGTADKSVSLDPFFDTSNNGFLFNFSDPIRAFSLLAGDFGRDLDELNLWAWTGNNKTGNLVAGAPVTDFLPARPNDPTWTQTRFDISSDVGFRSVLFRGGLSDFDVFVDRIFISLGGTIPPDNELDDPQVGGDENPIVVPEPLTLALLGLGGVVVLRRRRT